MARPDPRWRDVALCVGLVAIVTLCAACDATKVVRPIGKLPSGLRYSDIVLGSGAVADSGRVVTVEYVMRLSGGEIVDSSQERGQPFTFQLGTGQVIAGWDEGIPGMRAGGERLLLVPPELAYGSQGIPGVVPPNASLKCSVVLKRVEISAR